MDFFFRFSRKNLDFSDLPPITVWRLALLVISNEVTIFGLHSGIWYISHKFHVRLLDS